MTTEKQKTLIKLIDQVLERTSKMHSEKKESDAYISGYLTGWILALKNDLITDLKSK
jgi:hypothetical protein